MVPSPYNGPKDVTNIPTYLSLLWVSFFLFLDFFAGEQVPSSFESSPLTGLV